ncbi:MAG: hypothetical protein II551_01475 [Paludibacteraceae bacterium]|nr:hypothetical protein [Paludibacteraceae bacterium]
MKKFLTLVVALMMVIPMMAIGDNDGSTQLDAIDFNWDAPTKHSGGMKWYVVDLSPLYEEETPGLSLFLANESKTNSVHVSVKATVGETTETKSYVLGPTSQESWSRNASSLVRLKTKRIFLSLNSDGPVVLSAKVFEFQDLDDACKKATAFSWTAGLNKPAGAKQWYSLDLTEAKATSDKDVRVSIKNNGSQKATVIATQSLDCPSTSVSSRTIEIEPGETVADTIGHGIIKYVSFNDLYFSLENDQPITVKAEFVNQSSTVVLPPDDPSDPNNPYEDLHVQETKDLSAGQTYYFRISVDEMNQYKKLEPEFVFLNNGATVATVFSSMAFESGVNSAMNDNLLLQGNDELIEVINKGFLMGIDAEYVYLRLQPDQDVQLTSRFKHVREGKACKTNIDFDWDHGHRQAAKTVQWYHLSMADAIANKEDIIGHVINEGSKKANVKISVAFDCPYTDLTDVSRSIPVGQVVDHTFAYSTFAMMTEDVWVRLETDQQVKFWAETKPAKQNPTPDEACLNAIDFDWQAGISQLAGETKWYKVDMTQVRNITEFPTVYVFNRGNGKATVVGELSEDCPDVFVNDKPKTLSIAKDGFYSKRISRDMFNHIKADVVYLRVTTDQDIDVQVRFTEEPEGSSCSSAKEFNWNAEGKGHIEQAANANLWYLIDLSRAIDEEKDVRVTIINKSGQKCSGTAWLAYDCESDEMPENQPFHLDANASKSRVIENSLITDMVTDKKVYIRLMGNTTLRVEAELVDPAPFTPIPCPASVVELDWNTLYTHPGGEVWYHVDDADLEILRQNDLAPEAYAKDLSGASNMITVEEAFACPILKKMAGKSKSLAAGAEYRRQIGRSTTDQFIKHNEIYLRVTSQGAFEFKATLKNPYNGSDCMSAIRVGMENNLTQAANTVVWYRVNIGKLKEDDSLHGKSLKVTAKNKGGKANVKVAIFEDCAGEDILEDRGKHSVSAGKSYSRSIPAYVIYGLASKELYVRVETDQEMTLTSSLENYATLAESKNLKDIAKLATPNIDYTVKANEENWFAICLPMIRNNYTLTDNLYVTVSNPNPVDVKVTGTATWQDVLTYKIPERTRTIKANRSYHKSFREIARKGLERANIDGFSIDDFETEFIDSMLRVYITEDSLTAYVMIKPERDLKWRIDADKANGSKCDDAISFDWEHGNAHPANSTLWYHAELSPERIPEDKDLRIHVVNWSERVANTTGDMYFDCNEAATVSTPYTLNPLQDKYKDIDRDLMEQLGWAPLLIEYFSDEDTYIWAELVPNVPRDTLRDTVVAYVCYGEPYQDTIIAEHSIPSVEQFVTWNDTITFQDGVLLKDSITKFEIHPIVEPVLLTIDEMKAQGAAPLLVQGMQLYVDPSNAALLAYYRNLSAQYDSIMNIDTVYWAKPVYKGDGTLNDKKDEPLDLLTFYQKTDLQDTLLLVIKDTTVCDNAIRREFVFALDAYKTVAFTDTLCPSPTVPGNETKTVLVADTLGRDRYVDSVYTHVALVEPTLIEDAELQDNEKPQVVSGVIDETSSAISSNVIKQMIEDKSAPGTMDVTALTWEVDNGTAWQALPYTVPANATTVTMRYIITTECGTQKTSNNFVINVPAPTYKNDTIMLRDTTVCEVFVWETTNHGDGQTYTASGTLYFKSNEPIDADPTSTTYFKVYGLNLTVNHNVENIINELPACGSYTWNQAGVDTVITTSSPAEGYKHVFPKAAASGCDSIVTLHITINNPVEVVVNETPVCDSYTWKMDTKDSVITTSSPAEGYKHVFKGAATNGCDSIVTLHIVVNNSVAVTAAPVTECNSYTWKFDANNDTLITTSSTGAGYTHKFQTVNGCDSVVTLPVTIKVPYQSSLSLVSYYGDRLLMINRNEINAIDGWNLDSLDVEDGQYVTWYEIDKSGNETKVGNGYTYNLPNGDQLPTGYTYYAVISLPAVSGACGAEGTTVKYTIPAHSGAPMLAPNLARPGEQMRVLNLNPDQTTYIRVYTAEGHLISQYEVSNQATYYMPAQKESGFYLVEVESADVKSTLRYIVK